MPHQCTTCGHVFPDGSKEMLSGCPECGGNAFQFHPEGEDIPDEPPDADPPSGDDEVTGTVGRAASTVRNLVGGTDAQGDVRDSRQSGSPTSESDAAGDTSASSPDKSPVDDTTDSRSSPRSNAPWPDQRDDEADDADIIVADETDPEAEDTAQASARSDLATPDDLSEGAFSVPGSDADEAPEKGPDPLAAGGDASPLSTEEGRVVSEPTDEEGPDIAELREQLNDQFESIKIVEPGEYELNLMELFDREEYIIALQENGRYVIQVPEQWLGDRDED